MSNGDIAAQRHPDFLITLKGQDVTKDVVHWRVNDREDGMGSLEIELDNQDQKHSGAFGVDDPLVINFGQWNQLSAKIEMPVMIYSPHFGKTLTIKYKALDATRKLARKTKGGHGKEGTKIKPLIEEVGKEAGVQIDASKLKDEGKEPKKSDCARFPTLRGTYCDDALQQLIDRGSASENSQSESGKEPFTDGDAGQAQGDDEDTRSSEQASGIVPGKDPLEQNRLDNASRRAKSTGITGRLTLLNYPLLKAKKCINIQSVGPDGSGKWYIPNCDHSWNKGSGSLTHIDVMRSGIGKNACGGPQPNVLYAEIYEKDKIYAGPRKMDGEVQATLTFGDAEYVMEFDWTADAQTGRAVAKKGIEGKAINPNRASDPEEKIESKESDSGGGDQSAPTLRGPSSPGVI